MARLDTDRQKVQIGSVSMNNNYKCPPGIFKKQLTIVLNCDSIGLYGLEEIRKTLIRKITKITKQK